MSDHFFIFYRKGFSWIPKRQNEHIDQRVLVAARHLHADLAPLLDEKWSYVIEIANKYSMVSHSDDVLLDPFYLTLAVSYDGLASSFSEVKNLSEVLGLRMPTEIWSGPCSNGDLYSLHRECDPRHMHGFMVRPYKSFSICSRKPVIFDLEI